MIGKPKTIKMDQDPGLVSKSLQNWLQKENINIEITTSQNSIADIERVIKQSMKNAEDKLMNIEKSTYVYNHEITHDATGKTSSEIFLYGIKPSKNMQKQKEHKIDKLNKDREEHEVDLEYTKVEKEMKRKAKLVNPFKKTGALEQKDEKHWQETNRGHKVVKHISKFKKAKIQNLSPHSRETDSTDSDNENDHDSDMDENTIDNSLTN